MHAGKLCAQDLADRAFVHGLAVRVQKTDRDRLDAFFANTLDDLVQAAQIERRVDFARGVDALADRETPLALDERRRFLPVDVVGERNAYAPQLEDIAKAGR